MYYFVADETNVTSSPTAEFFIYGGLLLSDEQLKLIHDGICQIRQTYGLGPQDKLKFNTKERPTAMTPELHAAAKNAVMELCASAGVKFMSYLIHHNIATNPDTRTKFAINTLLYRFNEWFLAENNAYGAVIVDRMPNGDAYSMLRSMFQDGIRYEEDGPVVSLDRVLLYATSCDGASHISSAVDIVLGGFRWVVNAQNRPGERLVERKLLENVTQMMCDRHVNGSRYVRDYGFILRPATIRVESYQARYDDLVGYLGSLVDESNG